MTILRFPLKHTTFAKQEAAWEQYTAATIKAQETLALADGIAAGKAYAKFLKLFVEREAGGQA